MYTFRQNFFEADVAYRVKQLHHTVYLNAEFRADLDGWSEFRSKWNGCWITAANLNIFTDACGSIRCGAVLIKHGFSLNGHHGCLSPNLPLHD